MLFRNKKKKKHFAQQVLIYSQSSISLGLYDMKSKWFREKEKQISIQNEIPWYNLGVVLVS